MGRIRARFCEGMFGLGGAVYLVEDLLTSKCVARKSVYPFDCSKWFPPPAPPVPTLDAPSARDGKPGAPGAGLVVANNPLSMDHTRVRDCGMLVNHCSRSEFYV